MANNLNANPLFVDTTNGAKTGLMRISCITWTGTQTGGKDIAANDDFLVTTTAGDSICSKRAIAAGDDFVVNFIPPYIAEGIIVEDLDGGVCHIFVV